MASHFHLPRPLLMADSSHPITEAAVIHQLADCADRAGFISSLWMSYGFACKSAFVLKPKTVPLNVWHPYCSQTFYPAHPACSNIKIAGQDVLSATADHGLCRHVLSPDETRQLRWTAACPSVSMYLRYLQNGMASPTVWVPAKLSRMVPVRIACQVSFPPFLTLVNSDQLEETQQLHNLLTRLRSVT